MKKHLLATIFALLVSVVVFAQNRNQEKKIITYETIYDAPYEINKLWVHFQPLYTEVFVTNVNVGYGLEAHYMWADKFNFKVHFRKPYSAQFDHQRNISEKNSVGIDNTKTIFSFFEFGGTYHIKDWEEDTETWVYLYSTRYQKGNRWASMVPEKTQLQTKVRKIIGARAGGMFYTSNLALDKIMIDKQLEFKDSEGNTLPLESSPFTGMSSRGGYVGGSYTWIKNVAIDPDNSYSDLVKDLIFTAYFDVLVAAKIDYDPVFYQGVPFNVDEIGKNKFGARAGIEGRFNRTLGWAYNGEIGYRPGVKGRGLYALIKLSFPVYSTDLDNKVESFGK